MCWPLKNAPEGANIASAAALSQNDTIKYATLVDCFERRFGQKHLAPVKKRECTDHKQKPGERLQDYAAHTQCLAEDVYPNIDPEFVERGAIDSFVDGICDFSLQC